MKDLSPAQWQLLESLLDQALDHPPEARPAFLEQACPDEPALRRQLEAMLAAGEEASSFLQHGNDGLGALLQELHTPAEAAEEDLRDQCVGPYRLLRRVGRGGMGQVYLALRDDVIKQVVAVKIIRRGMDTEDLLLRFHTERQILASLNHPNIAQLHDGGATNDGRSYFVMEYVEGVPITEYCDRRRLPVQERLRIFRKVCTAVHYAHQNLVVHRDLKPSNILVTVEGEPKLLDFGIAKLLNPNLTGFTAPMTRTDLRVMTPEYASPEQVRGGTVTTASDVYSLGVLLYELLAGHRPYQVHGRGPAELERLICETDPAPPSTAIGLPEEVFGPGGTMTITPETVSLARRMPMERLRRLLRGDLDTIVLMALRKEPDRRYPSAEQLSEDVGRYLDGLPVNAQRPTFGYRTLKFMQRHSVGVTAAAALVLLLLVVLVLSIRFAIVTAAQSERLEVEAAKTEEVKDFLIGLFEVSDPENARGAEITAIELLERGARQIDTELAEQPAIQAEMLHTMGVVYRQLGLFDKARPMLERSLVMSRSLYGQEHPEVARSLFDLSWLLDEQGDFDDAEHLLREALALQRRLVGEKHLDVARSVNDLGIILAKKGELDEAEANFREALGLRRELLGTEHEDVAESMLNLAWILHERAAYDEAEALYQEIQRIQQRVLGADHPQIAVNLTNLGAVSYDKGAYDRAEAYFMQALALRRKVLGEEHPLAARLVNWLGRVKHKQGAYDEAERLYLRAMAVHRKTLGENHPSVARGEFFRARLLYDRGEYEAAVSLYQQVHDAYHAALPEDHPYTAEAALDLAGLLLRRRQPHEAEPLFREAEGIYVKIYGEADERAVKSRLALGRCLTDLRRFEEAEHLLLSSQDSFMKRRQADQVAEVRRALVRLYTAWGQPDRAATYARLVAGDG